MVIPLGLIPFISKVVKIMTSLISHSVNHPRKKTLGSGCQAIIAIGPRVLVAPAPLHYGGEPHHYGPHYHHLISHAQKIFC